MSGSSSHCDSAFESADGSSRGSSSPTRSSLDLVEQHFVSHLKAGFSTGTEDCRPIVSTLRASSLHTQQRIPIQYRRSHSSSTPYCDDADSDNSDSDEMEATARAIRALAPSRRRPYQTISRSSTLLTTPVSALFRPQGISSNTLALCEVTAPSPSVHISLHGGYHLSSSEAEVELFLRLNHARQTVDFVHQQSGSFARLNRARMGIFEALDLLSTMHECQAALLCRTGGADVEVPLLQHAYQTAELCRLAHPDKEWMQVAGLIHSLGNLLGHACLGSQPQWAICSESFPVGCRQSPHIMGAQYFSTNPDRRRRLYNSTTGCYSTFCGLSNVAMSWSGPEYLHTVLLLNQQCMATPLPREAMFLLRHQNFLTLTRTTRLQAQHNTYPSSSKQSFPASSWTSSCTSSKPTLRGKSCDAEVFSQKVEQSSRSQCAASSAPWVESNSRAAVTVPSGCYSELLSAEDLSMLPLLAEFQTMCGSRIVQMPAGALEGVALVEYYDGLLEKYFGGAELRW